MKIYRVIDPDRAYRRRKRAQAKLENYKRSLKPEVGIPLDVYLANAK